MNNINDVTTQESGNFIEEEQILNNSHYWDKEWYCKTYYVEENALAHFCTIGWKIGYNPSKEFSTLSYLELNPDVRISGMNPLLHYEKYGKQEGRNISPVNPRTPEQQIIGDSPFWDESWYQKKYEIKEDALEHFCNVGWKLGNNPSAKFSIKAYVKLNPDINSFDGNPLLHYLLYGSAEFRLFEPVGYPD